MARLEADRAALERSGFDASATKQLMVEVARRLAELDKLVVNEDAEA